MSSDYCNAITSTGYYCRNRSNGRLYCRIHHNYEHKKELKNIEECIFKIFKTIRKNAKIK